MLKGHFVFRLPWRRYLSLQITRMGDALPADWRSIASQMLTGKRAVDPELMARAWWYEKCERLRADKKVWDKVRLLERKCAAQRTEIKLLTKRLRETAGEKHGRTE